MKRKLHWKGWECVKGGIEKGESKIQAIRRELKEEAGLKAKKIINMKMKGKFLFNKSFHEWPKIKGVIFNVYAVEAGKGKVRVDNYEHTAYKWLEYEQAREILTWPDQKKVLKIVNDKVLKSS